MLIAFMPQTTAQAKTVKATKKSQEIQVDWEIPELNYVNLGVLPANENTKALSKAINVTSEDVKTLKKLLAKNIEIDIQQVPTEAITHVDEKLLES